MKPKLLILLFILSASISFSQTTVEIDFSFLHADTALLNKVKMWEQDDLPEQNKNYPYFVMILQTPIHDPDGNKLFYYLLEPSETDVFVIDKRTGVIYTTNHFVDYILGKEIFEFRIAVTDGVNHIVHIMGIHICEACLQGLNPCYIY